jgi:hypothetical protein
MGLFKSLKKAFKKVVGGIKKAVKGVVKGVKKVVKKISSSKILKALAIAAAVVVTGGAALTAFGGTGALSSSAFGQWMMSTSQSILGGAAFGTGATSTVGKFVQGAANFTAKTVAAPFGAVGGAIGSTARVGANLLNPNATAFQAGPAGAGTAVTAPTPFSGAALSGQNVVADTVYFDPVNNTYADKTTGKALTADELKRLPDSYKMTVDKATGKVAQGKGTVGRIAENVATGTATAVLSGAAMAAIQGDPDPSGNPQGLRTEGATQFDPLRVYAAERGIADTDISKYFTFGNTASAGNMPLFQQQTIGVPA